MPYEITVHGRRNVENEAEAISLALLVGNSLDKFDIVHSIDVFDMMANRSITISKRPSAELAWTSDQQQQYEIAVDAVMTLDPDMDRQAAVRVVNMAMEKFK
ncbi:MAG: hypothetical protein ACM31L_12200 [Actinomycetota bacterium]